MITAKFAEKRQNETKSLLPFTLLDRATMQLSKASRDWLRKQQTNKVNNKTSSENKNRAATQSQVQLNEILKSFKATNE